MPNVINGTEKGESIQGSFGDDSITAFQGNDTIFPSLGNDTINAGVGANIIQFYKGHGQDVIKNGGGEDTIALMNSAVYEVSVSRQEEGDDLYINYGTGDRITVENYFAENHSVKHIIIQGVNYDMADFAQGIINGTAGNDNIFGSAGNDSIFGRAGNDTIMGAQGNDVINAGAGYNIITFYKGHGDDTVVSAEGGDDTLYLPDSALNEVSFVLGENNDNNLYINYGWGDKITIEGFKKGNHSTKHITIGSTFYPDIKAFIGGIKFGTDEGESITGVNSDNEKILGLGGDDTIFASLGDDTINGGLGNNVIEFYEKHGQDIVENGGGNDTLLLHDSAREDVTFTLGTGDDKNLYIDYSDNGRITVQGYQNGNHSVRNIIFGKTGQAATIEYCLDKEVTGEGIIDGEAGNDTITGSEHNDTIMGAQGNDIINAGGGNNILNFWSGHGSDTIQAGTGEDTIVLNGIARTQVLSTLGTGGDKNLYIQYGANDVITVEGYQDEEHSVKYVTVEGKRYTIEDFINNAIYGTEGNDSIIFMEQSDDSIKALGGDDTIMAGLGNDIINGGLGNNQLNFYKGHGRDTVVSGGGFDTIVLPEFAREDVTFRRGLTLDDGNLYIEYSDDGRDVIKIQDYFNDNNHSVQNIIFGKSGQSNAISYFIGQLINDKEGYIEGTGGNDTITGSANNDTIMAAQGDDIIDAGAGDNILNFYKGHGSDTVISGGGNDNLALPDSSFDEVRLELGEDEDKNLYINYGNGDKITVEGYQNGGHSAKTITIGNITYKIQDILNNATFTYGGRKDGTFEDDSIVGFDANDTIMGSIGNDTINAGGGYNVLEFWNGHGQDVVENGGGVDTILLGNSPIYAVSAIREEEGNDLYINYGNGDRITVKDYFAGNHSVQNIIIQGVTYPMDEFAQGIINGTNVADNITGTAGDNSISGFGGDDVIMAAQGNDKINAGAGNNIITFFKGHGDDTIVSAEGGNDTVYLADCAFGEVSFVLGTEGDKNLYIYYGNNDKITVENYQDGNHSVKHFTFGVGQLYYDDINYLVNRSISATTDTGERIDGGAGNDTITGRAGNDTIMAAQGNDLINAGLGNNELLFYKGHGSDTVTAGGGNDIISLPNSNRSEVSATINETTGDLIINYGDGDSITLQNYQDGNFNIKRILIGDKVYGMEDFLNNAIYGTDLDDSLDGTFGNDVMRTFDGNDSIFASLGDDTINAGLGNNIMHFYNDHGQDVVENGGGVDTLILYDVSKEDVTFTLGEGNDKNLYINYSENGRITVQDYQNGNHSVQYVNIQGITYSIGYFLGQGATIYGTPDRDNIVGTPAADDIWAGAGNNTISAGMGNDTIHVQGADVILLDANCGNDVIDFSQAPDVSALKFVDIADQNALETINVTPNGTNYTITYGNNTITLVNPNASIVNLMTNDNQSKTLAEWINAHAPIYTDGDASGSGGNDTIIVQDNAANPWASHTIHGLGGNDVVHGSNQTDYIYGDAGNDSLFGNGGDDRIQGGIGNDILSGGTGSNTLIFNSGDGHDIVQNGGGFDKIDIQHGQINYITIEGRNLVIHYGSNDSITVENWNDEQGNYLGHNLSVKTVDDGLMDIGTAFAKYHKDPGIVPVKDEHTALHGATNQTIYLRSSGDDVQYEPDQSSQIYGGQGNDYLIGSDSNDNIYGGDGNDTLVGGPGTDRLWGNGGSNTFIFNQGDGADIIYEYNADNTLQFTNIANLDDMKDKLKIEVIAGGLLSGGLYHGYNYTQQILSITGYGFDNDSVRLYNEGYENYKLQAANGDTISMREFIVENCYDVTNFIRENFALKEGSNFGGTVYVPTNMETDLSRRSNFISMADNYGAKIYSGGNAGFSLANITGSAGDDIIYNGLDKNGNNKLYFKINSNDEPQEYDLGEWGYARLCYKVLRDENHNPIVNPDGTVDVETNVEVGGYFYSYGLSMRANDYTDIESTVSETLTQAELVDFYQQYLVKKAAGETYKDYDFETIAWDDAIDGTDRYYDSFAQYRGWYGNETYDVKVNYYKPDSPIEDFETTKTGNMTEWFRATYNNQEVWMMISRTPEGTNFPLSPYQHYGYSISSTSSEISGGAGNDVIYTRTSADGGEGNDTIYTMADAAGGAGNDRLIAFNAAVSFDGGSGYDLLDFRNQDGIILNEYGTDVARNYVTMSEGVDTVLLDSNNGIIKTGINLSISLPEKNPRFIETRFNGYQGGATAYMKIENDLVLFASKAGIGAATVIKDYDTIPADVQNNLEVTASVTYYTYNAEAKELKERYGNLGIQSSVGTNSNHKYLDYWSDVKVTDGDTMYVNAASNFDYNGEQYADNFVIRTETEGNEKRKYIERTIALDSTLGETEKGINVLNNGNILYKNLTGYKNGKAQYETVTILNDGGGNYYTESWNTTYEVPASVDGEHNLVKDEKTIHFEVQYDNIYGLKEKKNYYHKYYGINFDDSKTVRLTYDYTEYYREGNFVSLGSGYENYVDIYENEGGKFTMEWVDGYFDEDHNWIDGYYREKYLEPDGEGNYILPVQIGHYSDYSNSENSEDIVANVIISKTAIEKDDGNLLFTANVGDGEKITGTESFTIYQNAKIYLRQDDDGTLYFNRINGIDENGNRIYEDVKIGKVNEEGVFTEIYGDSDLFNQNAYYSDPDVVEFLENNYSAVANTYSQDDFLVGGAGAQKIYGGKGNDVIYGGNLPVYEDAGQGNYNLSMDTTGDELYGGESSDYIIGGEGSDYIDGGEGTDRIFAGGGNDTIVGGKGINVALTGYNDGYNITNKGDEIYGEAGDDVIYSIGKYNSTESHEKENLFETQQTTVEAERGNYTSYTYEYMGDTTLDADGGNAYANNYINGGDGNDIIIANAWSDSVDGGDGDDTIVSYKERKVIDPSYYGGYSNSLNISGGKGNDVITLHGDAFYGINVSGDEGNDIIDARDLTMPEDALSYWNDYTITNLSGGDGNDIIYGSEVNDDINAGAGNDVVYGYGGNDSITVGDGAYNQGASYAYGGEGNDTLTGGGEAYLYGEAGDDVFYNEAQTGTVINPSRITMDGGSGNDKYIRKEDSYGFDTIIASSGSDEIIYTEVSNTDNLSVYRYGDDLVIKNKSAYGVVGGSVPYESLLTLKDYYNETNAIYGDEQNQTAKELFDNYKVTIKDGSMTRISLNLQKFINYVTGGVNKITSGIGTPDNDFMEPAEYVTDVYGYAGDDNILSGKKSAFVSGGSDNDVIQGNDLNYQVIVGDNGDASVEEQFYPEPDYYGNYNSKGYYNYTYTPSTYGDGNDNIVARADNNFVWGEGGDDTITVEAGRSYLFGGAGNDSIELVGDSDDATAVVIEGGSGNDTIIGGAAYINGGDGDDIIKHRAVNNSTYSGTEQVRELIIARYQEKGVDTDAMLQAMDAIEGYNNAISEAITNKKSAQSYLDGNYGYAALDSIQSNIDYKKNEIEAKQNEIDALEPENKDYAENYLNKRTQLDNLKRELAGYEEDYSEKAGEIKNWETQVNECDATVAAKKALIAEAINSQGEKGLEFLKDYANGWKSYGAGIIEGGAGNDTITLGYNDTPNGYLNGTVYVKGGAGDDTYVIPQYSAEDYEGNPTHYFSLGAKIVDEEGDNIIIIEDEHLTSANLGMFINVELEKDENGEFVQDEHGNYTYNFANFTTEENNGNSSPIGNGDMGFCVVLLDDTHYNNDHPFYGISVGDRPGLKFDEATLEHFTKIQASDGKYITKTQIEAMAQNTANWLAEHGYSSVQDASNINDTMEWSHQRENQAELLSYKAFGSLQWLDENSSVTEPATEGTVGTYMNDTLTSTSASEIFTLYTGNDTVKFSGVFGDDIIQSASDITSDGSAKNVDTLNLSEYSIKEGTLKFEVVNNTDLKFTAYGEDGNVKGTVTYENFVTDDFTSRTLVINDKQGEQRVTFEDEGIIAKNADSNNTQWTIYNDSDTSDKSYITFLTDTKRILTKIEAGRNYNYTQADENTSIYYDAYVKSNYYNGQGDFEVADKDVVLSQGETNDTYDIYFTKDTDAFVTDEGGNDILAMRSGNSNSSYWKAINSSDLRIFFDVDYKGNISDTWSIIHADNFNTDNTEHIANLLNGEHTMKGVATFTGEIEKMLTDDHLRDGSTIYWDGHRDTTIRPNKWKSAIANSVAKWLSDNGFPSVEYVMNSGDTAAIKTLIALYDVKYDDIETSGVSPVNVFSDKVDDDVSATDGDDVIYLSQPNTTVDLGKGKDVVNIANSAGGNTIKTEFDAASSAYGSVGKVARFVLPDTVVNFSIDGKDLLINSEDLAAPIRIQDFMSEVEKSRAEIVVQDKEKTYMVHGAKISQNINEENDKTTYGEVFSHVYFYDAPSNQTLYAYTNEKDSVINIQGGMYSDIQYRNSEGTLTVNNTNNEASPVYTTDNYEIQSFTSTSGVLINDAGGNDEFKFNNTKTSDFRIFFDVTKDVVEPETEQTYTSHFNGVFVHAGSMYNYDALIRSVQNDWTAENVGIVKFNGLDNHVDLYTRNFGANEIDLAAWTDGITAKVGVWLDEHEEYNSVTDVLTNGTDEDKAAVMALYDERYDLYQVTSTDSDDIIPINEGLNEITFNNDFGNDTINNNIYGSNYNYHDDYLKFLGRSFDDGTLGFERVADSDNENKFNSVVFRGYDENGEVEASAAYDKMLQYDISGKSDENNEYLQIEIEDKNGRVYHVVNENNSDDIDLTQDISKDQNHIVFINYSKTSYGEVNTSGKTIISNENHNIIESSGGARLVYNYNGGHDKVNTTAAISDDCFDINSFTTTTSLNITDAGGKDTINFHKNSADELRFVYGYGTGADTTSFYIVHKDALAGDDFADVLTGATNELKGAIKVKAAANPSENNFFGIETINTSDHTGFNFNAYKGIIDGNLAVWFSNHGTYQNTDEVFASEDDELISSLLGCYNVNYNDLHVTDLGPYMMYSTSENDTFTFNDGINYLNIDNDVFGNDTITSGVTVPNNNNYDVVNFTGNGSLQNNSITYNKSADGNDLIITTRTSGNTGWGSTPIQWTTQGTLTYSDFFDSDTIHNNLIVKDYNGMYNIESYNEAANIDWSTTYEDTSNPHVAFLNATEGTNIVQTGGYQNIIYNEGGADLNLTYNDNESPDYNNKVDVKSLLATDDTYNIDYFSDSNTYVKINDNGGNDTLNINADLEDMHLMFNVNADYTTGDKVFIVNTTNYADGYNGSNYNGYSKADRLLNNKQEWESGTISIDAVKTGDAPISIETVNTNDVEDVDMETWYDNIKQAVAGWLGNNEYGSFNSSAEVFASNNDDAKNALFQVYADANNSFIGGINQG